ncbi:fimbrial chaperone protein [Salmonella enterica subsp. salamae]|nr:fimbrial chaperone [Salmonella enterica subsp. salamae]ECI3454289.1 fimbrial chaperone protein [Salmonella enterica subsp. salamae]ECJ2327127.1 fimbrial chaperone [Salmonella enterica subsp. salamae]
MKWGVTSLLTLALCGQAMAAFTISGTRFIYAEGRKNISFEVTNNSDDTYGGQVWVDNISQNSGVYMVPTPPFFKVNAKQKQIVRIIKTDGGTLPTDRESLFWLNIQEIPPKPKTDENVLSVAVNTRVKLFYRPKSLVEGRKNAEKKIEVVHRGGAYLKNSTPYYFAIAKVKVNGKEIPLTAKEEEALAILAPFSEVAVSKLPSETKTISVDAINDWGGVENHVLKG